MTSGSTASRPPNGSNDPRPGFGEDRKLFVESEDVPDRARRQMHGIFVGEIQALEGAGRTAYDYDLDEIAVRD